MTLLIAARNSQTDKVNSEEEFIEIVSDAFIKHLLNLRENDSEFVVLLKDTLRDKQHDKEFFAWLSKKLDFKFPGYLKRKMMCWEENEYKEKRGSSSLSLEDKQHIHDLWIGNSIPSADF